jgi:hypothetical protein
MKRLPPILAIFAILTAMVAGYVCTYLMVGRYHFVHPINGTTGIYRYYTKSWQATVFKPAAWVEQRLTGTPVHLVYIPPGFDP